MSLKGQLLDRKSLRAVTGRSVDWAELAKDCVAFANGVGGRLLIGIEDSQSEPPPMQRLPVGLADQVRRRMSELTVNVSLRATELRAASGGEWLELAIERSSGVACTTDGRYYLRVGDASRPVIGDEVLRLVNERSALPWETLTTLHVPRTRTDSDKQAALLANLRASDRVKSSVKEKSDNELIDHYLLAQGEHLTHLGVLCMGRQADRARLGTAPSIQFIKRDGQQHKVNKLS